MPISIQCDCGKSYRVKDELAGRKVRCAGCGQAVTIPRPSAETSAEDEALAVLLADSPEEKPPPEPVRFAANVEKPSAPPERPPLSPRPETPPKKRPIGRLSRRDEDDGRPPGPSIVINPEIVTGVGMMVIAAVWFFAGMAANRIFYYPPVLFVLGIAAIIRGFTGGGSE